MSELRRRFDPAGARLIFLPSILSVADIAATLIGQPSSYWDGRLDEAYDANPAVVIALNVSPWLALPAAFAWVGLISAFMLFCSPTWRRRIFLFLCISHFVFVGGWIIRYNAFLCIPIAMIGFAVARLMKKQYEKDLTLTSAVAQLHPTGSTFR